VIVLDTHALLWLLEDATLLSSSASAVVAEVEKAGQRPIISGQSLYEIAWGLQRGRIQSTMSFDELLGYIEDRFMVRSLTSRIAITAAQLPATFPSDPFDRIIAATALVEGVPLVTADKSIRRSRAVATIW
jgi:PIN domain nuclease of toxin-antitoxin system